jgi:hypothetical protein
VVVWFERLKTDAGRGYFKNIFAKIASHFFFFRSAGKRQDLVR